MHASTITAQGIRLPRHCPSSERRVRLGWRKLCQPAGCDAKSPLHLRFLYWIHLFIPLRIWETPTEKREQEVDVYPNRFPHCRRLLSIASPDGYRGNSESLLAGCRGCHVHDDALILWKQDLDVFVAC